MTVLNHNHQASKDILSFGQHGPDPGRGQALRASWAHLLLLLLALVSPVLGAEGDNRRTVKTLSGIGYTEQELQLASTKNFRENSEEGIPWASFGGGTTIQIKGKEFAENPQSHSVSLYSHELKTIIPSVPLSENDAFLSNPLIGKLVYKLPHLKDLFAMDYDMFDQFQTMTFTLYLDYEHEKLGHVRSQCEIESRCYIKLQRKHTPVVYGISPPINFRGSEMQVWFDPKQTPNLIEDLAKDDLPYIHTKIGGYFIDFEGFVDSETTFAHYYSNAVRGKAGEQPIGVHDDIVMLWEVGNSHVAEQAAKQCSFDNTECYTTKTVPVIEGVSASKGYTTGGQLLTIRGYGFNSTKIRTIVDGVECALVQSSLYSFTCKMKEASKASDMTKSYTGQHGVRKHLVLGTSAKPVYLANIEDEQEEWFRNETLALNLESIFDINENYYGNQFKGWFIPPLTTNYRFYATCDDDCSVELGNKPNDPSDVTKILDMNKAAGRRDYWRNDGVQRKSEWVSLTAGEPYYIEARHYQWTQNNDHITVAVEIEQTAIQNHHNSFKEIQKLAINVEENLETFRITIEDGDFTGSPGSYKLILANPDVPSSYTVSDSISVAETDPAKIRKALYQYFYYTKRTDIEATIQLLSASEEEVAELADASKIVIEVKCLKLSVKKRVGSINVVKSTTASIAVESPEAVQLSSPPLTGSFKVKCVAPDGTETLSDGIPYNTGTNWMTEIIMRSCGKVYDKIELYDTLEKKYHENGRSFFIRFFGMNADPGQFEIISDTDSPLMQAKGISFTGETIHPYSSNLFYEPVPYEMLRTFETTPQVLVSVEGIDAACPELKCGYEFVEPVGEITGFTFNEATKLLSVIGTSLPTEADGYLQVVFAKSNCTINADSLTSTGFTCALDSEPTCGNEVPEVISAMGIIPNAAGLNPQVVQCTISAVHPLENLNLIGADNLTFTGTNFPKTLSTSEVTISFSDSQATTCVPQESSSTKLVCLTSAFNQVASAGAELGVIVNINGQAVSQAFKFKLRSFVRSATAIRPASVSPILKQPLVLQLENEFPYTLSKDDFTVNLTSTSDPSYLRYLNVVEVDDNAKTLKVMFGGARSGTFSVAVRHRQFGLLNSEDLVLDVSSTVTSVSPQTISINGGTLLTITGTNFGKEFTDNPVQISYNGGVGSTDCFLTSISSTEIKCRLDSNITKAAGEEGTLVVFQKTSEESPCPASKCKMTFSDQIPTITSMATSFDSTLSSQVLMLEGTGFEGDAIVEIQSLKQETLEVTPTSTKIKITNLTKAAIPQKSVSIFFDIGTPNGYSVFSANLDFAPAFVSLSRNSGSVGGSIIRATVPGLGFEDTGVDLVDAAGESICAEAKMVDYATLECRTVPKEITSTAVSLKFGSLTKACLNDDASKCLYEQVAGDYASVTSVASDPAAGTLTFAGANFPFEGSSAVVELLGIPADAILISSASQVVATWNLGLPPTDSEAVPKLSFAKTSSSFEKDFVLISSTITNALSVTSSTSGLSCSFAGGCLYEVEAQGLATLLKTKKEENYLEVCSTPCPVDELLTTKYKVVCRLPPLSTLYSNKEFKIAQSKTQYTGHYFGIGTDIANAFDKDLTNSNTDSSSDCNIGTAFKAGHVGLLNVVKFYIGGESEGYSGNLVFQGSADNSSWTDIFPVDDSAHQGWNSVEFGEGKDFTVLPAYRFYRFKGASAGVCQLSEIELQGVETVNSEATSESCSMNLVRDGTSPKSLNTVTYTASETPLLSSISPRFGSVVGGEVVAFTGTGFGSAAGDVKVTIDGVDCSVSSVTDTEIKCTTGPRPGLVETSLEIFISGKGSVSLKGLVFLYANYWSADTTWGGEFAPIEGESVHVPKGLNLLVDVDSTPVLNAVVVEGTLIFAPEADSSHQRNFDARYIYLNGGTLEAGTEEFPYTSKLTITMHGNISDPYLPLYGNKCIGVRYGTLDLHGAPRTPTWTVLETTAEVNATTITLREAVDWKVGEEIAIASSSFEGRETDRRTIMAIDRTNPDKPVLTLNEQLTYRHFAATETFGDSSIDMRAEVGLLTRTVKFRGDPETSGKNQYGAIIFMHSLGDDSLIARLGYTEFYETGQAFKIGRYTIHFHLIGSVHKSYAIGNAVHQAYNRAFTIHGTQYLRLEKNVGHDIMGHAIFMEDAIERNNYIANNLIFNVKRSWSLLNTDQTPACFWITNPDNYFIENHAGGSDRYSYWFDLQKHPIGPSATTDVCPENEKLGEFRDNHAHSNGRYGLRIFHNLVPRKYPCKPITYDLDYASKGKTDPYWENPLIPAKFYRLTSWKNKRNGAIAGIIGAVQFHDFKTIDNKLAGIEFEEIIEVGDLQAKVEGGTIVGRSEGNIDKHMRSASPHGIITPRSEYFSVQGTSFHVFNWANASAIGSCSHCFHPAATDSGARQTTFGRLTFGDTVAKRIRYQLPWRAIFYDLDGTLTGLGPRSWATHYYNHLNVPECQRDEDKYNGVICDGSIQVRRVAFHNWGPASIFTSQPLYILPLNKAESMDEAAKAEYFADKDNYGKILFKDRLKPSNGWAVPFVTGHKYKVHWGESGLDWTQMTATLSVRWEPTDLPILFVHNYTDTREKIDVTIENSFTISEDTLPEVDLRTGSGFVAGQNKLLKDVKEFHFIAAGNITTKEQSIKMNGHRCVGSCNDDITEVEPEEEERLWSKTSSWPDGKIPVEGDEVHIESGWNMILDVAETPIFKRVRINGLLTFKNDMDITLRSQGIFVRAGELRIGTEDEPYEQKARIILHGDRFSESVTFDNSIEGGNKVIANIGTIKMFGKKRTKNWTRLHQAALRGETKIRVEPGLDLVPGDRLGLLATSFNYSANDDVVVKAYNEQTGFVQLEKPLEYYHYGKASSTFDEFGVDVRGEVLLLSRNIQISGDNVGSWGGQIVTSDTAEIDSSGQLTIRNGQMILDSVEIYNCSQIDTFKAALRFEEAKVKESKVSNSAIHNGLSWGINIQNSANIVLDNNVIFSFKPIGVGVTRSNAIRINGNVLGHVYERDLKAVDDTADRRGGFAICSYWYQNGDRCTDIHVTNNIAGGISYAGFLTYGHDCGDYSGDTFKGNVAHSIEGFRGGIGAYIFPDPTKQHHTVTCYEGSRFTAYKCALFGVFVFQRMRHVIFSNMLMLDNAKGMSAHIELLNAEPKEKKIDLDNLEYKDLIMEFNDNKIYGDVGIPDCPDAFNRGDYCVYLEKFAVYPGNVANRGKEPHIKGTSSLPPQKIKGDAQWGGRTIWRRNTFKNFKPFHQNGQRSTVFGSSHYQPDYIPMLEFYDTTFEDVEHRALANFLDPLEDWVNIDDCGTFSCTAPKNILYKFKNTKWKGKRPASTAKSFELIHSNDGFAPFADNCKSYASDWNGYFCENDFLGVLLFESLDSDRWDRAVQPVKLNRQGTEMNNVLNAMMDHIWDGFYSGQTRLSRFPAVVDMPRGSVYDITYTGTPPKKQHFKLITQNKVAGATIRIAYPSAMSMQVTDSKGKAIPMNTWDESKQQYKQVKQKFCGENRYIGIKNILEFYISGGCSLRIMPRDAIQTMVRMEWSLEEFFSNGGTTKFIDRLTASLGIHASEVKVVSVYQGSLVVNYEITAADPEALTSVASRQTDLFAQGSLDLGAPILDAQATTVSSSSIEEAAPVAIISDGVVTAPGYKPIVITQTESNQNGGSHDSFDPIDITSQNVTEYENVTVQEEVLIGSNATGSAVVIMEDDSSSSAIVAAALLILVTTLIVAGIRYFRYQQQREQIEADIRLKKKQEYDRQRGDVEVSSRTPSAYSKVANCSTAKLHEDEIATEYNKQFDPKDFTVFGSGANGLTVEVQDKIRKADEMISPSSASPSSASASMLISTQANKPSSGQLSGGGSSESEISEVNQPKEVHGKSKDILPEDQEIADGSFAHE